MEDDLHVIPVDDIFEHLSNADCPCHPKIEVEGEILIYIHNSWDKRELFEGGENPKSPN